MTVRRLRNLAATLATIALVPGGAPAALGDTDADAQASDVAVRAGTPAITATDRQRRVESAWLAEQRLAARQHRR
jgi:hypothetical protein